MYQSLDLISKAGSVGVKFVICTASPFLSILRRCLHWCWFWRRCGCMNQLLGLERTTFERMTGRVLAEHYRDGNNRALGNQMKKKKKLWKGKPKALAWFCSCRACAPICTISWQIFTRVSEIILGGNCVTVCAILLTNVKTGLWDSDSSVFSGILLRICNRSSRTRKISARSLSFWLTTLRFFFLILHCDCFRFADSASNRNHRGIHVL